jgi:hypothetical protein
MSRTIRTQGNYMTHRGGSRVAGFALPDDRQLFLAAPDLLEAAVHALEVLRDREWSGIGHLRSQLEEAIAKANATTGQEEE